MGASFNIFILNFILDLEPICKSLHQYNDHIESLKREMEDATASATQVKPLLCSDGLLRDKMFIVTLPRELLFIGSLLLPQIRSDIAMFRSRYAFVQAQDKCEICSYPVIVR